MNEQLIQQIASNVMRRLNMVVESEVHPSQQLFDVGEANEAQSAVREFVEFLETRECSIEKGKSCDHCGTCRSLGF